MKTYLTYDDVNIIPKYSELGSREDVKLNTRFTKNTELQIPIVTSPMDTVTELDMAKFMLDWGGVGVIHRFMSIEKQSKMMNSLFDQWKSFWTPFYEEHNTTHEEEYNEWLKQVSLWNSPPTKSDWVDLKERFGFVDERIQMDDEWLSRPLCGAIGVTGDYKERAQELVKNGCNVLLIDIAHGHHVLLKNVTE